MYSIFTSGIQCISIKKKNYDVSIYLVNIYAIKTFAELREETEKSWYLLYV